MAEASVYFYNAPLGSAPRITSGDYLEHVRARCTTLTPPSASGQAYGETAETLR